MHLSVSIDSLMPALVLTRAHATLSVARVRAHDLLFVTDWPRKAGTHPAAGQVAPSHILAVHPSASPPGAYVLLTLHTRLTRCMRSGGRIIND